MLVDKIKRGSVSDVFIQTVGSGYEVNDKLTFTGGDGITRAEGVVSVGGGNILLEDSSGSLIIDVGTTSTEEPFNIALESTDVIDLTHSIFMVQQSMIKRCLVKQVTSIHYF